MLLQALAVFFVLFADFACVAALPGTRSTNAERFRRGLPPLPPRNVVSNHKRYVHPVRPRNAQSCPSSTPVSCAGNCNYIVVTETLPPNLSLGYVSAISGTTYGFSTVPCLVNAAVFILPEDNESMFKITQNSPAAGNGYRLFGVGGPDHASNFDDMDSNAFLYLTSTDEDNPDSFEPNYSDSPFGAADAESTVWSFQDVDETTLQLNYAPGGVSEDDLPVTMTVLLDQTTNTLIAVSDPGGYMLEYSDVLVEVTLTLLSAFPH